MKSLSLLLIVLLSAASLFASGPVDKASAATHQLFLSDGTCSAVAIGPQAILTAAHCVEPSDTLRVDKTKAHVETIFMDTADHAIFILTDIKFDDYVAINGAPLPVGARVFVFGYPAKFSKMYREGYVSGFREWPFGEEDEKPTPHPLCTLYDLNGFYGDSGAGVFDPNGVLVSVVGFGESAGKGSSTIKFTGSYELQFPKWELDMAKVFTKK